MKKWSTEIVTLGAGAVPTRTSSYRTYKLPEMIGLVRQIRAGEKEEGQPVRSIQPVSTYTLEELIQQHLRSCRTRFTILESIKITEESNVK